MKTRRAMEPGEIEALRSLRHRRQMTHAERYYGRWENRFRPYEGQSVYSKDRVCKHIRWQLENIPVGSYVNGLNFLYYRVSQNLWCWGHHDPVNPLWRDAMMSLPVHLDRAVMREWAEWCAAGVFQKSLTDSLKGREFGKLTEGDEFHVNGFCWRVRRAERSDWRGNREEALYEPVGRELDWRGYGGGFPLSMVYRHSGLR